MEFLDSLIDLVAEPSRQIYLGVFEPHETRIV